MTRERASNPRQEWGAVSEMWRQQTVPTGHVRELRRRALDGRRARPSALRRAWLPAVATLVVLLAAHALREAPPRSVLRADLRKGHLHLVWFQPISGEAGR